MIVRMVKPQFRNLVISGQKCQTVRPWPKRMPKVGDNISLREWTGKPYRSKQRVLKEAVVTEVLPVTINSSISVDGQILDCHSATKFSRADGFDSPSDMIDWFREVHGPDFVGICIYWK